MKLLLLLAIVGVMFICCVESGPVPTEEDTDPELKPADETRGNNNRCLKTGERCRSLKRNKQDKNYGCCSEHRCAGRKAGKNGDPPICRGVCVPTESTETEHSDEEVPRSLSPATLF